MLGITSKQLALVIIAGLIYWLFIGWIWTKEYRGAELPEKIENRFSLGQSRNSLGQNNEGVEDLIIIQGISLKARSPVEFINPQVLASIVEEGLIYKTLINCLAQKESSNNPKAINPADPITASIGLLQFKKGTWKQYCVDKYDFLESEIWDGNCQRRCCDLMLQDNFNNLAHWSTAKFCR
jgi:hypothetical protein